MAGRRTFCARMAMSSNSFPSRSAVPRALADESSDLHSAIRNSESRRRKLTQALGCSPAMREPETAPPVAARLTRASLASAASGLTRQKAAYVTALAESIARGELQLSSLSRASDAQVSATLTRVPGIGPWTASIYLLMALRRPDVWPLGDLALHKALAKFRCLSQLPSSDVAARLAERWAPYRAVAARILWHGYLADRAA